MEQVEALWLAARGIININPDDDDRVGSATEDGEGGTLSASAGSKGSSLSKLGATFIPVVVYVAICLILFFVLRRRYPRVYAPRCNASLRAPELPTPSLPDGWFNWVKPFFKTPDTYVLNHGSLDGFFFLRYLKVLRNICVAGCLIIWPVLFPVNATGGRGMKELELLTIGNVVDPNKLYAHAAVAWVFFGFVLFTVVRENIYYTNIRQAYLSSPYYAKRLSSRTVIFTSVPQRYLDERRLRKLYGDAVKRVWIPHTSKSLANLVKEREQTALRLEKAEVELIRKANRARNKQLRAAAKKGAKTEVTAQPEDEKPFPGQLTGLQNGDRSSSDGSASSPDSQVSGIQSVEGNKQDVHRISSHSREVVSLPSSSPSSPRVMFQEPNTEAENNAEAADDQDNDDDEYVHPYGLSSSLPDVRGSVAAQYVPAEARPHHRPLGNFGRRVDTIRWTRVRLGDLNAQIYKLRRRLRRGDGDVSDTIPAAFVEFDTQEAAQAAHQVLAHHQPSHMAPRLLGVRPDEVVWSTLRIRWWERVIRRFAIIGFIVAAIVFWSIPSLIVGMISNVDSMSKNISFLNWISTLPGPIIGFLSGFVPALALTIFMSLVPVMLRACAIVAGVPTHNMVELFTQTAYFAFQVVQVFLVTTLSSAASSAFFRILLNPIVAKDLLAMNLPRASNFYISYILIQCLASAGTHLLNPLDLLRQTVVRRVTQFPRFQYKLWRTMRPARWGRDFPVFANLGVIALCYACIAPLILIFAAGGMAITHIVWRYNLIYVIDSNFDSKGLFYPRALTHLIVGLYLACFCLLGLFFINTAIGPGVMMALFLVVAAMVHSTLVRSVAPLLQNLPQTLSLEEEIQEEEKMTADASASEGHNSPDAGGAGLASSYYDMEEALGDEDASSDEDDTNEASPPANSRAVEGASEARSVLGAWFMDMTKRTFKENLEALGLKPERDSNAPPSILSKWLNPHVHEDFIAIRKNMMTLPLDGPPEPAADDVRQSYHPPEMWAPRPILWIPRDEARVSRQEVAHTRGCTPIHDKGATMDENGMVTVDVEAAPFALPRLLI